MVGIAETTRGARWKPRGWRGTQAILIRRRTYCIEGGKSLELDRRNKNKMMKSRNSGKEVSVAELSYGKREKKQGGSA